VKELATFLGLVVMMIGFMLLGYHKGPDILHCSRCGVNQLAYLTTLEEPDEL
jgi:hypothetical protein